MLISFSHRRMPGGIMAVTVDGLTRYRNFVFDNYRWDGFEFRPDDVLICTPPKAGTTWMQTLCALLLFQTPDLPCTIDEFSPWVDMQTRTRDAVFEHLGSQQHRRFIKTHTPLDGIPYDENLTYICVGRDPRDIALSWDNHWSNIDQDAMFAVRQRAVGLDDLAEIMPGGPPPPLPDSLADRFWLWVDAPIDGQAPGLAFTMHAMQTYWQLRDRPNVELFHYAELKADLPGQMRRLAGTLGIDVSEDVLPALVSAASFDRMRQRADVMAPETSLAIWKDNAQFFHRGVSGQWREILDDDGARRYSERVAALAPPDLVEWAHRS